MTHNYSNDFESFAQAENTIEINGLIEVGIKHWSMEQGKTINYQKDDRHTLSLYLKGGKKNYRTDNNRSWGAPGKICLMPQGHNSQWQITEKVEFVHLYFSDTSLKNYAASHFGMDVRFIELYDLLFEDDVILRSLLTDNILVNNCSHSSIFVEQSVYKIMHHLLENYNGFKIKEHKLTGGLSPYHMKYIRSLIFDELDKKLTIAKMAQHINLSPYHFARMFKTSFGDSPAQFITRARIQKVKELLNNNLTLSDISIKTGFNQQSHMTQYFKKIVGITPDSYRRKLK